MSNVDAQELAKFSALAHRWWDPNSEFRPLHEINPLRLDWIDALAHIRGKRVVDVGCGGGILAEAMAQRGASVLGIDLGGNAGQIVGAVVNGGGGDHHAFGGAVNLCPGGRGNGYDGDAGHENGTKHKQTPK